MSTNNEEMLNLIEHRKTRTAISEHTNRAVTAFKIINAVPRGASSWASTFGPVAIHYKRGLWLIAPVATGAVVSLTDEAVSALAKRYPDNKFLNTLNKGSFFADHGIGGFFADFGFAWNMITTVAIYAGGVQYHSNDFAKIIAPAFALLPSIITRQINYKRAQNILTERSLTRHVAGLFRGLVAPAGVLNLLLQQGIIEVDSPIPTTVMGMVGVLGLLGSLFMESHPVISKSLFAMINLICENPSLAAALFHFPNDIYAATHNDEISDEFFFTNVGLTSVFLTMLTLISVMSLMLPPQQTHQVANDEEASYSDEVGHSDEESNLEEQTKQPQSTTLEKDWRTPKTPDIKAKARFLGAPLNIASTDNPTSIIVTRQVN